MILKGGTITELVYEMSGLKSNIRKIISCETSDDPLVIDCYSVDASHHVSRPQIIIFPENDEDVSSIIRFAASNKISVTARGAGSGLAGGALGRHIILDFKKMNKITLDGDVVTAQAGAIKGIMDEMLLYNGKFFSPDPSVGKYCTIGGMVGTNAGGSHALKYGCIIENILGAIIIDGTGRKIILPDSGPDAKKILGIARRIDRKKFPVSSKNSCGYRLDAVQDIGDAHRVLAGSEGTLGIVTSARFRVRDIPKERVLVILSYKNPDDILVDICSISGLYPAALEYVDEYTVNSIGCGIEGATAALLVEFDEDIESKMSLMKLVRGTIKAVATKPDEIQEWWSRRGMALAYSLRTAGEGIIPGIVEDAAVPVKNIGRMLGAIKSISKRSGTRAIVYGHAGNGNLHVRLVSDGRRDIPKSAVMEFFRNIWGLGGTITAEHGDGMSRSEFVKMQYGARNYRLFMELKRALDPLGILNPGKIVTGYEPIL